MANLIENIRSKDEYRDLYEIASKLRNQKLINDAETDSLNRHRQDVVNTEIELLTEAWRSSNWNNVGRLLKNQTLDPSIACQLLKEIDETEAIPAYKHIGHHYFNLSELLGNLYNEPLTVAELLNSVDQNNVSCNDSFFYVFFHLVFSCGLYPEDELRLAQVVCYLLKLQLFKAGTQMRTMLRKETSISTRFYKHFVELMHPSMVYLTKALRTGVLNVIKLGSFWLDVDAKQSTIRFNRDSGQDEERFPEYRALVVSKLVELVDTFLACISQALPMLPPNLNWIIREIFCSLYEMVDDVSAIELSHACKDMVISNLICPAIISPQKFGVVDNDVRIGTVVNHNLVQVAMIIQMISLREFEAPPDEYTEFLRQCTKTHLISEMMDALLMEQLSPDVEITEVIANGSAQSDMPRKSCFVGSIADANLLTEIIRRQRAVENSRLARISSICEKLPDTLVSNVCKSPTENLDNSPKVSTLRNFHRKVQHSFKRSPEVSNDAQDRKNNTDAVYSEKNNFDIFYLDYIPENYQVCISLVNAVPPVDHVNKEAEDEAQHDFSLESCTDHIASSNLPEETDFELSSNVKEIEQHLDCEPKGSFSKLKNISDRMKKGIAQSNTLFDLRGHLRRSGSGNKQQPELATSRSEQLLTDLRTGPRDDILAKYASISSIKEEKPVIVKLIEQKNCNNQKQDLEPYYSSENIVSCRAFQDTLRKLVTVLGNVSYLPRIGCRTTLIKTLSNKKARLYSFLDGVLVEAEYRQEYGQAAQLREVKRCIELFEDDGIDVLIEHLKLKEKNQEDSINEMREARAELIRKSNDISSMKNHVSLHRRLTEQILVDFLMRTFLETGFQNKHMSGKTSEVIAVLRFYDEFKNLQVHDERAEFLQKLLEYLKIRLLQNSDWNHAKESMISRAMTTIERYVMFSVYESAFYPNKELDKHRDKLLRASIAKVADVVTPVNDFLKIPERLHAEAPWPSAQAELSMLDVYVTAQDKLNCVVRCCDVINNLVALSSKNAVASADDLTPVLVFVIIKANPKSLLSTLQFVETFAGDKIETGRDAYYWTNFKSAVEYIKTIL